MSLNPSTSTTNINYSPHCDDDAASASASASALYATVSSAPPKRRAGRTKFRETRHPVYKGVRQRGGERWVCEVREPNNGPGGGARSNARIWLGTFPTAEMAARAHDVAALALRGRAACLNFADSPRVLRLPESRDPRDIRKAAAAAAEAFRPPLPTPSACGDSGNGNAAAAARAEIEYSSYAADDGLCDYGMYVDMARGMLIDPPAMWGSGREDESGEDVALWSHSI
ncbi:dehydration-responsive element-binding protein 1G-like [Ananas comosus]|uniref:Dehydration-responsive element-binding protein 1G-like n=1 Tax=Ananas comosus TaxID=4615 RepID=A0A6P5FHN7_ANACO|nr:dehydration-responsive element-binding protein 1G-like [Ananas comosus]